MLGDTLTFTLGGTGGTAKVLSKINQDKYSAEYLLRSSTDEVRARVRHSKETVKNGSPAMERHNVELTQTVFAAADVPEKVRQCYIVLRTQVGDDLTLNVDVAQAVALFMTESNLTKLTGWES